MTHARAQTDMLPESTDETPDPTALENAEPPGWFSRTYAGKSTSHLAENYARQQKPTLEDIVQDTHRKEEAYEAYKRRLDERFSAAQHQLDPAYAEHVASAGATAAGFPKRPVYGRDEAQAPRPAPRKQPGRSPATLAILTLSACALGGTGGYVAANPDTLNSLYQSGMSYVSGLRFLPVQGVTETVIAKKPIQTARLEVNDTSGAVNAPIPLDILATPIDALTPVAIRISGLPSEAYLTKGVEVARGEWVLSSADIAKAALVVPRANSPVLALQVAALEEKTGIPAAPSQNMNVAIDLEAVPVPGVPQPAARLPAATAEVPVIVPASAVPDQGFNTQELPMAIPQPLESTTPQAQNYIAKGNLLLESGDILAARQFYLKAFDLKASAAAFGVGQTYDPAVYAKHAIAGLAADPVKAAEWYSKAAATGHTEAAKAMAQLSAQ
jgi:hypothetical protein